MGRNFFINCDEATTICDQNQYGEASIYDKLRLSIHLLICKHCKKYTQQNNLMSQLFGKYASPCENSEKMPSDDKNDLARKLEEELKDK